MATRVANEEVKYVRYRLTRKYWIKEISLRIGVAVVIYIVLAACGPHGSVPIVPVSPTPLPAISQFELQTRMISLLVDVSNIEIAVASTANDAKQRLNNECLNGDTTIWYDVVIDVYPRGELFSRNILVYVRDLHSANMFTSTTKKAINKGITTVNREMLKAYTIANTRGTYGCTIAWSPVPLPKNIPLQ